MAHWASFSPLTIRGGQLPKKLLASGGGTTSPVRRRSLERSASEDPVSRCSSPGRLAVGHLASASSLPTPMSRYPGARLLAPGSWLLAPCSQRPAVCGPEPEPQTPPSGQRLGQAQACSPWGRSPSPPLGHPQARRPQCLPLTLLKAWFLKLWFYISEVRIIWICDSVMVGGRRWSYGWRRRS